MWWQQSLWKLPPDYTGLAYWVELMGKHAAIPLQAYFVNQIVLPHLHLFAPVVYAAEVLTAVSLILGLFVRVWALIGAAQILNLWLGLYSAPGEWPWTYFFLLVLMLVFALHRYGRSLGLDAHLRPDGLTAERHTPQSRPPRCDIGGPSEIEVPRPSWADRGAVMLSRPDKRKAARC